MKRVKQTAECKHDWEDLYVFRASDGIYIQQKCRKCQKMRYVDYVEPDKKDGGKETE